MEMQMRMSQMGLLGQKRNGTLSTLLNAISVFFLAALLFGVFCSQNIWAQTGRANISGTVADASGAVVADAKVSVTNVDTGVVIPTRTNSAGVYNVIQLIPGTYTVKVEKEGFSSLQREPFTLVAEQNAGINFTLQPGKVSQQVSVSATGELLHTETAELSQTINAATIEELPLNSRNPAELVLLTPGTLNMSNASPLAGSDVIGGSTQGFTTHPSDTIASSNGGRTGSTYYMLDGAYNLDNYYLAAAPFPNPDAVEEFTVLNNNFDPRYGFAAGGVVSVVTKSGTNNWHGNVFEFLRNAGFNASDYFTGQTNQIHRNQFGGSLGGPIMKDKLFIFGNYQGTRQSVAQVTGNGYIPTSAMINNGDFSAYCQNGFDAQGLCLDRDSTGTLVTDQIYTANVIGYPQNGVPLTVMQGHPANAEGQGGLYYPNNQIDPTTFSPGAVKLINTIDSGLTPINQYGSILGTSYKQLNNYNEETIRADYNLSDRNRISGRAFLNYFNQPPVGGANAVQSNRSWINHWQSYAGTWTTNINPHIVNNATFSYARMYDHSNSGLSYNGKGACYSEFIATTDPSTTPCSIESLGINGGYQSSGGPPYNWQNFNGINRWTTGFSDSVSISSGKHLIVAGVDFLKQYWYENTDWTALPIVSFGGGPQGQFTGNGFSDYLLGDMQQYWQGGGESNIIHATMIAPYVADQIKLKPNFTVSLGLRYEPFLAPVVSAGRIAYFEPGAQSTRYPTAPVGMLFPGDPGVPKAGGPSDYHRYFDPRIGFAWQPKQLPNTSVRAAFGMYASPMEYSTYNHVSDLSPFSNNYVETANQSNGSGLPGQAGLYGILNFDSPWSTFYGTNYTNPFPAAFANPGTSPSASSATFALPIAIETAFSKNFTNGRTYTWNFSVEHEFGSHWVARAAYVGSESDHVPYNQNIDVGQPICGPVSATCAQVTSNVPIYNPALYSSIGVLLSNSTSNYQSGQFTLEKKFSNGLQFTANYTWAHDIGEGYPGTGLNGGGLDDPGCLRCNRGNLNFDVPQTFVVNFVYKTPALSGANRATQLALGGWQLSGIFLAHSGLPMTIYCGCTSSWQLASNDWAQLAPGVTKIHTHPHNLTRTSGGLLGYLSESDFDPAGPPQASSGNAGYNPPGVYGPGVNTWTLGMGKTFKVTERVNVLFRWEAYNAFNRVTFNSPWIDGTNYVSQGTGVFGLITTTDASYPARVMQGALKVSF
jgi:hypothetical protein